MATAKISTSLIGSTVTQISFAEREKPIEIKISSSKSCSEFEKMDEYLFFRKLRMVVYS